MATLPDYPFINQLNSPTLDGGADNNKWFNCVVCAIMSVILYFQPQDRGKISPDLIKDAVYGGTYANQGTDITRFLLYANQHGVAFSSVRGTNAQLVAAAHTAIREGHPVIMTEVDPYVDTSKPEYAGWLHSGTFYAEGPGTLSMMDPFGGKLVEKSDALWETVLRTGTIWIGAKDAPIAAAPKPPGAAMLAPHMHEAGWTDTGTELWAPDKKHRFVLGFREAVLKAGDGWDAQNWPLENEHTMTQLEDSHPELGGGTQQLTVLGGLNWNEKYGVHPMAAGAEVQVARAQIVKLYATLELAKADIATVVALLQKNGIQVTVTGGGTPK